MAQNYGVLAVLSATGLRYESVLDKLQMPVEILTKFQLAPDPAYSKIASYANVYGDEVHKKVYGSKRGCHLTNGRLNTLSTQQ